MWSSDWRRVILCRPRRDAPHCRLFSEGACEPFGVSEEPIPRFLIPYDIDIHKVTVNGDISSEDNCKHNKWQYNTNLT